VAHIAAGIAAQSAGQRGQVAHLIAQNEGTFMVQGASDTLSQRVGNGRWGPPAVARPAS
jgi:hypothetical protein